MSSAGLTSAISSESTSQGGNHFHAKQTSQDAPAITAADVALVTDDVTLRQLCEMDVRGLLIVLPVMSSLALPQCGLALLTDRVKQSMTSCRVRT